MPSITEIAEIIGLFIALIVIAVFRTPIWKAIKELLIDLALALVFTLIVVFAFGINTFTLESTLFVVALAGIFIARLIYFKFINKG